MERSSACFPLFSCIRFVREQSALLRLLALFPLDLIRQALVGILLNALQSRTLLADTFQVQVYFFILVSIKEGEASSSGCRQQSGYWLKKKKKKKRRIFAHPYESVFAMVLNSAQTVSRMKLCPASQPRSYCFWVA